MIKKGKDLNKRLLELKTKNFLNYLKTSIEYINLEVDSYEKQLKQKEYMFFLGYRNNYNK